MYINLWLAYVWSLTGSSVGLSEHKSQWEEDLVDFGYCSPSSYIWKQQVYSTDGSKISDRLHLQNELGWYPQPWTPLSLLSRLWSKEKREGGEWEWGLRINTRLETFVSSRLSGRSKVTRHRQQVTLDFSWQFLMNTRRFVAGQKGTAAMSNWCHDNPYSPFCSFHVSQRQIEREILLFNFLNNTETFFFRLTDTKLHKKE